MSDLFIYLYKLVLNKQMQGRVLLAIFVSAFGLLPLSVLVLQSFFYLNFLDSKGGGYYPLAPLVNKWTSPAYKNTRQTKRQEQAAEGQQQNIHIVNKSSSCIVCLHSNNVWPETRTLQSTKVKRTSVCIHEQGPG